MHATLAQRVDSSGEPMVYQTELYEPAAYTVTCFPARSSDGEVQNWTLKQLGDDDFRARLCDVLPPEERTYYAPSVDLMSGAILPHDAFSIAFHLDGSRRIRRPGYEGGSRLACDGTFLEAKEAGIMTAGGCPLIVLNGFGVHSELCLFGHGGRDSLIDPSVHTGKPPRKHFSVVEAMVACAREYFGAEPQRLLLRSFFSLPWRTFKHDQNDPRTQAIHAALKDRRQDNALIQNEKGEHCLSLNELIRIQAEKLDISFVETGLFDLPEDGDCAYTRHPSPELAGSVRNLVVLERL